MDGAEITARFETAKAIEKLEKGEPLTPHETQRMLKFLLIEKRYLHTLILDTRVEVGLD